MATGALVASLPRARSLWSLQSVARLASSVLTRSIYTSRALCSSDDALEKAKERLKQLTADPGNQVKLKLYGLYKQVI